MNDLPLSKEANDVAYVWIIRQTKNIVIGEAGLLLCRDLVRTTFSAFSGIQAVRNGVDPVLQAIQDLLKALPVHVAVAGGQFRQQEHLVQDAVDLVQGALDILRQRLVFGFFHGLNTIPSLSKSPLYSDA